MPENGNERIVELEEELAWTKLRAIEESTKKSVESFRDGLAYGHIVGGLCLVVTGIGSLIFRRIRRETNEES